MRIDARLPVRFGPLASRQPDEAVLTDAATLPAGPAQRFDAVPQHAADCACCMPRSAAALAMAALFRARVVGQGAAFRGVLAVVGPDGARAVRAALEADPLVSGRFRSST